MIFLESFRGLEGTMKTMPRFGLGLYKTPIADMKTIVDTALAAGYRLFDTATVYRNEEALGLALRDLLPLHELDRSEIWITSKLAPIDHGYESTLEAVKKSVERIGAGPIDLYLVHWPGKKGLELDSPEHARYRRESWKALEECLELGLVRHIGVSNYELRHLEEMKGYAKILPFLNQVEIHPLFPNLPVIEYSLGMGIDIQAYSSLALGKIVREEFIQRHTEIQDIAAKKGCTPSQLYLAWALRKGYAVIPKSVTASRIKENIRCLKVTLTAEELSRIDRLADDQEAGKQCWNSAVVA